MVVPSISQNDYRRSFVYILQGQRCEIVERLGVVCGTPVGSVNPCYGLLYRKGIEPIGNLPKGAGKSKAARSGQYVLNGVEKHQQELGIGGD